MVTQQLLGALALLAMLTFIICDHVVVFDESNFEKEIVNYDTILVEFYAPWCGHCQRLEPEYAAAADELIKHDPPIYIAKIDCTKSRPVCHKFGVKGFPTLKLFKSGQDVAKYEQPRTRDDIVKYMKSRSGPASVELTSVADTMNFISKMEPGVLGIFEKADGEMYRTFMTLAGSKSEDFRFAHSTNAAVREIYGHDDNIVILRPLKLKNKFEEEKVFFSGKGSAQEWLTDNIYGLCGHRTTSNSAYFKQPLLVAYYNVDYVKNPKGTQYWRNRVMKVAKKFADKKLNFAISNVNDHMNELNEFGIDDAGDKPVVLVRNEEGVKYKMVDEFSMATFETFLKSYHAGKIEPYLKSEALPEDNDAPVKTVVAKNFDEIVNDVTKDVLIEFYAPWCGHCKSLEPKYTELAEKLKEEPNVVIAKMDATANDVPPPYKVSGFPTIFFAPKDSKSSPKKYSGAREVKDFLEYLANESTLLHYDSKGKKVEKSEL